MHGQATWGSCDEQSVHSSRVERNCLAQQYCWVAQLQPSVSHRVMLRVEVRRMTLLPSRPAMLLLLLPRPHQVWQPTSLLAQHTLPAIPYTDIHCFLHVFTGWQFCLPVSEFKSKKEIICTVVVKCRQLNRHIPCPHYNNCPVKGREWWDQIEKQSGLLQGCQSHRNWIIKGNNNNECRL